jgi:hypothetical protein
MELDPSQRKTTRVYIDSSQVTTGSVNDFELILRTAVENVVAFQIENLAIPHSYLNMNPTTGTLSMPMSTSLDGAFTLLLDNLPYTDTSFITALNAAAAVSAPLSGLSFTFANGRLNVTTTAGTASISAANISASNMWSQFLGWTVAQTLFAGTAKGNKFYNLGGPGMIFIHSRWLSAQSDRFVRGSELDINNAIYGVIVNANTGGTIYNVFPSAWQGVSNRRLVKLDFSLRYNDGSLIDLQGLNWQLTINLISDHVNY